jgi:hypothetical protein
MGETRSKPLNVEFSHFSTPMPPKLFELLKDVALCVSRVLKYPKKCLEYLTMFFMSTLWMEWIAKKCKKE